MVPRGNFFSANGVRTIRVSVYGNRSVDLSSLVLAGKLHNGIASPLQVLTCGIHGLIQRFTVYVNGAKADDQLEYGRLVEQMTRCMPENVRRNLATMSGFRADTSPNSGKGWLPDRVEGAAVVNFVH